MKKLVLCVIAAALASLLLVGCQKSSFSAVSANDNTINITAENADTKNSAITTLTVGENEQISFDASKLTSGKLQMEVKNADGSSLLTASVSSKDSSAFDCEPGEYNVDISVLEKASGSATISTVPKQ